jgi:hypothetical protein
MNAIITAATPALATRFAYTARVLRAEAPLNEDQMRATAPSIFAAGKHVSRSERYTYIPTIDVLRSLRREGFEPFMVAQGASRIEGKSEFTKHMVRLRHARDMPGAWQAREEAPEVILINSHDGASSYQMLAGMFRHACQNGLIVGDVVQDIRIAHKGRVQHEVTEAAFQVLDQFGRVHRHMAAMKTMLLSPNEQTALATAALALRFGARVVEEGGEHVPAPVTAAQLLEPRRREDFGSDLWSIFQRVSENALRGGQPGRGAHGRRLHTRAVTGIDRHVTLSRAMWGLADEMRSIKAGSLH